MAQAFVREIDDAPPPPLPEHPVSPHANFVTARGASLIEKKLEELRDKLSNEIDHEMEMLLARDLRYWQTRRATMQVLGPDPASDTVAFGSRVTISRRGQTTTLRIVGEDEADPAIGLIGWTAPLARALQGASEGEEVEFFAPGHRETVEILAVGA
ncbi:GreA/GreB family elongation factor [Aureimonas sp. ME7]|uniref:GreA/GreB family elongation factor n=1 Tax=Aureimonas sp. ME7 TaxID=2744252 RepID=UPI0015F53AC0|nr:GreA/GreB family elongation factor [Aureimonas sp. ME7]